jgi:tryptophanyl-tRNA synthetase
VRAFLDEPAARATVAELEAGTTSAAAVQDLVVRAIEARLEPIRARRAELQGQPGLVDEILVDGTIRAREVANQTLARTREAMGLQSRWDGLVSATEARAKARRRPY